MQQYTVRLFFLACALMPRLLICAGAVTQSPMDAEVLRKLELLVDVIRPLDVFSSPVVVKLEEQSDGGVTIVLSRPVSEAMVVEGRKDIRRLMTMAATPDTTARARLSIPGEVQHDGQPMLTDVAWRSLLWLVHNARSSKEFELTITSLKENEWHCRVWFIPYTPGQTVLLHVRRMSEDRWLVSPVPVLPPPPLER
jgi:hypothetical protein